MQPPPGPVSAGSPTEIDLPAPTLRTVRAPRHAWRFVAVNAAAFGVVTALSYTAAGAMATPLPGGIDAGIAALLGQGLLLLVTARLFDLRAGARHGRSFQGARSVNRGPRTTDGRTAATGPTAVREWWSPVTPATGRRRRTR